MLGQDLPIGIRDDKILRIETEMILGRYNLDLLDEIFDDRTSSKNWWMNDFALDHIEIFLDKSSSSTIHSFLKNNRNLHMIT
jgi:hypothetical protein